MKNKINLFIVMFAIGIFSFVQTGKAAPNTWANVGIVGFSGSGTARDEINFAFNPLTSEPYAAFEDVSGKATVMRFDGNSWVVVGNANFSDGDVSSLSIAFNPITNEPYVAFYDWANSEKSTVMKFNGSSWVIVGSAGIGAAGGGISNLAFNSSTGEPYFVFKDTGNGGKATAMKFDGTSWLTVGSAGFSSGVITANYGIYLAFDLVNNNPYVAFTDASNSWRTTVMKFDGSSWVSLGAVSWDESSGASLAFNPSNNELYLMYDATEDANKATVKKYDGTSWTTVGSTGFTPYVMSDVSNLAFDPVSNEPYIVFTEATYGENGKTTAMKYNGSSWVIVGDANFSGPGEALHLTLAFNPSTHEPYLSYSNIATSYSATMMKFNSNQVSAPTSSVITGTYTSSQSVTLSSSTVGAAIYYTTDGGTPTPSSSLYSSAITVSTSKAIKAIAVKSGMSNSDVMSEVYTFPIPIQITSPGIGYTWNVAETHDVTWTVNGVSKVKIYLYDSNIVGSGNVDYITPDGNSVSAATGTYAWTIGTPHVILPGANYRIRIDAVDDNGNVLVDGDGNEIRAFSGIFSVEKKIEITYTDEGKKKEVTPPRTVTNSKKTVKMGQILTQRGKKFSKNTIVELYFSKFGGGYYAPQKVKTSSNGSFSVTYKVNKPKGTYKWYALDTKTGKKSKTTNYKVK